MEKKSKSRPSRWTPQDHRENPQKDGEVLKSSQPASTHRYLPFHLPAFSTPLASMEEFRSRSCGDGRMEMEVYGSRTGPPASGLHDLRCYSASHASWQQQQQSYQVPKEIKFKKGKSAVGSSSSKSGWSLSDPELQRKKRVVGYKAYAMEGKMKGSLRKSFRWVKERYTQVVYGWW